MKQLLVLPVATSNHIDRVTARPNSRAGSDSPSAGHGRIGLPRLPTDQVRAVRASLLLGLAFLGGLTPCIVQGAVDVTGPGDYIRASRGSSPSLEGVCRITDNNNATKYLNFVGAGSDLIVSPSVGSTVVTGITITSAADVPARDPASFILYGRNDSNGSEYAMIARGVIPVFAGRSVKQTFSFTNVGVFKHYRLVFPTLQGPVINPYDQAFQAAELELLGVSASPKTQPTISWTQPELSLVANTPVNAAWLTAVPSVPGTLIYDPPVGTLLTVKNDRLRVTLIPDNQTIYNPVGASIPLVVTNAPPAGGLALHNFAAWDAVIRSNYPPGSPGGFAYLAVANGQTVASGTGGFARATNEATYPGVPWTLQTPHQIASVSKAIAGSALVKLWEQRNKDFSFDDPFWNFVQARLPAVSPSVKTITLRDLLHHASGVAVNLQPFDNPTNFESALTSLVVEAVGCTNSYDNANFYLLQLVIESLSGTLLEWFVQSNLLAPAGILNMGSVASGPSPVLGYSVTNPHPPGFLFDLSVWPGSSGWPSTAVGYGNWWASVSDLTTFAASLRQVQTLSPSTAQMMFSEGLGWYPFVVDGETVGYQHNGGYGLNNGRARALLVHFNNGVDFAMLANSDVLNGFENVLTTVWKLHSPCWTNALGGDYQVASHWLDGQTPGPTDSAVFTNASNYQINWTANAAVAQALFSASGGTVTEAIGSSTWLVTNRYVVGQNVGAAGNVTHASGTLRVTNASATALLEMRRGTMTLNAGLIEADRLLLTNNAGHFSFNSGTLAVRSATGNNGQGFEVGNGSSAATYRMSGVTADSHSFANYLLIANNALLTGNGTISGQLILANGATLSPGTSIGKIVLNTSPQLVGNLLMEISKNGATLTNDQLQVNGPVTFESGYSTLTVNNLGPTALAAGDRFVLFNASSYTGGFLGINLPALALNLIWTNKLLVDGSIEVLAKPATIQVVNANNSGPGSLRQALVDVSPGGTITFAPALNGQKIVLTSGPLNVNNNVTLAGPGPGLLTVQRSTAGGTPAFRVLTVNSGLSATLSGLTFSNGNSPDGGGLRNDGTLTVSNCVVSGNQETGGSGGGGIVNFNSANLTVVDSTIANNSSATSGGGIAQVKGGNTFLTRCTFSGNSAATGGGLYNQPLNLYVNHIPGVFVPGFMYATNCTFSGNTATTSGSAAYNVVPVAADPPQVPAILLLFYCTAAGNTGSYALVNQPNAGGAALGLISSIVASNGGPDIAGIINSGGYNLIGNNSGAGGLTGTDLFGTPVTPLNPLLGSLTNNGGPTFTRALLTNSPALNAGNPAFTGPPNTDQRGAGFNRIMGGRIDIGAFESQTVSPLAPLLVKPVWSSASNTFRFVFTNMAGAGFSVLTSTNLALPLSNWTVLGGVIEVSPGNYQFTDPNATNGMQRFYRVRSP